MVEACANPKDSSKECAEAGRTYAKVGMVMAFYACLVTVIQLVYGKAMTAMFGLDIVNALWYPWLRMILSAYVITFPVVYFMFQKVERTSIEQHKMTAGQFICCVFMSYGIIVVGFAIGAVITLEVSRTGGSNLAAPVQAYDSVWGILAFGFFAPVFEELVFRKLLIDRIGKYGEGMAILTSGLLFGLFSLFSTNLVQFFFTTGIGIFFAYIYLRTGRVRYTIALHMISNFSFNLVISILLERQHRYLLLGWLAVLGICGLTGCILWIVKRKKFYLKETPCHSENRKFRNTFGNPGMICYVILFALITFFAPSGIGREEDGRFMRQGAWIAEIDGPLRENLRRAAGVNEFLSEEERNLRLDALLKEIKAGELNEDEIVYRIQEIISDIHIGHIGFNVASDYVTENYYTSFQIYGKWFSDGLYILRTMEENKECLGGKLTAINGISIEEVLSRYDRIISNETEGFLKDRFERILQGGLRKSELEYLEISEPGARHITITVEKDGVSFEQCIKAVKMDGSQRFQMVALESELEKLPYGEEVYRREGQPPFYYEIDKEHRALYLQYNECKDATTGGGASGYPYFAEFFDELIQSMKDNEADIDYFVLDLRNNLGGGEELWNNAVTKYRKYLEKYPIKILIGKSTFSAAVDAVDMTLHVFDDVTLYGEETGLAVHNYTAINRVILENTGSLLAVTSHSDFCYEIHRRAEDIYAGVMPDVEVRQTFEGYLNGIDEVYQRAVSE